MLFKLKLGVNCELWGLIGKNDKMYWGAMSVAKLLAYKAPHQFVRHRSSVMLKDVVEPRRVREYEQLLKKRLFTHNRLLTILDRSKSERAQLVYDHFNRDNFYVQIERRLNFTQLELCSQTQPRAIKFFAWIEACKRGLFELEETNNEEEEEEEEEVMEEEAEAAEEEKPASTETVPTASAAAHPVITETITTTPPPTTTTTTTDADTTAAKDTTEYYSPHSPSYEPPQRPRCCLSTCTHCGAPSTSDFIPYSPSDPPYDPNEAEDVAKEKPEPIDLSVHAETRDRKRCRDELEGGITIWLSEFPPKKILVLKGNNSMEFLPKNY